MVETEVHTLASSRLLPVCCHHHSRDSRCLGLIAICISVDRRKHYCFVSDTFDGCTWFTSLVQRHEWSMTASTSTLQITVATADRKVCHQQKSRLPRAVITFKYGTLLKIVFSVVVDAICLTVCHQTSVLTLQTASTWHEESFVFHTCGLVAVSVVPQRATHQIELCGECWRIK